MADRATSTPRGIDHVGITVPDVDAASAFLEAALGAEFLYDTHTASEDPQQGAAFEQRLHVLPGTKIVRIRALRLGNGPGLELFQMEASSQAPAARPSDFGIQHVGLYVDDMDAALERFRMAGGTVFAAPHALPPLESGDGNRFCYGQTPWGTIVEFLTYPSEPPYTRTTALRRWTPDA